MAKNDLAPEEVTERGTAVYDQLRSSLEPALDGQFVAIHTQSGDYALGRSTAAAMRAIRKLHDHGPLFLRKIGSEPEYGLAARLLEADMRTASNRK